MEQGMTDEQAAALLAAQQALLGEIRALRAELAPVIEAARVVRQGQQNVADAFERATAPFRRPKAD
jgi:hypothetical protein